MQMNNVTKFIYDFRKIISISPSGSIITEHVDFG